MRQSRLQRSEPLRESCRLHETRSGSTARPAPNLGGRGDRVSITRRFPHSQFEERKGRIEAEVVDMQSSSPSVNKTARLSELGAVGVGVLGGRRRGDGPTVDCQPGAMVERVDLFGGNDEIDGRPVLELVA